MEILKQKAKAVPLQACTGPEDSRRMWLPNFKVVRLSALRTGRLYPQNIPGTHLRCLGCIVVSCLVCIAVSTLDAGLLARSQYSEGPATGHLDTGFSWFPCVYKQMLRWFPTFQVATTCFSCSSPDLNLVVTNFISCIQLK